MVRDAITCALFHVRLPHLVTVEHDLVAERDRSDRAFTRAFRTLRAKILQPEVDRLIDGKRHVRGNDAGLETRADKRIQHQFADAAEFAESGPQDQRDVQYVLVHDAMAAS